MPTLKVSGEDDVRVLVQHGALMDMAQGPIVVASRDELLQATGGVVVVVGVAAKARVQQANVDQIRYGRGIAGCQIVGDRARGEALPVDNRPDVLKDHAAGSIVG